MSLACIGFTVVVLVAVGAIVGTLVGTTLKDGTPITPAPSPTPTPTLPCPLLGGTSASNQPIVVDCGDVLGDIGICEAVGVCLVRGFRAGDVPTTPPSVISECRSDCPEVGPACSCNDRDICFRQIGDEQLAVQCVQ